MINRVLIRIKTVQLLYSYLLVEKPFTILSAPSAPTKEKRFAYSLYLDMLMLMYRVAHIVSGKRNSRPLRDSRFIRKLENEEYFNTLIVKYSTGGFPFAGIEHDVADEIKQSLLFKEYEKSLSRGDYDDTFWEKVFKAIIMLNSRVTEVISKMPNYTLSGVERMNEMMDITFKEFYSTRDNIEDALKSLAKSMAKARDLYFLMLLLPVELTDLRLSKLEENSRKHLATPEDLNPNMRLVNNSLIPLIRDNEEFETYVEKNKLSWKTDDPILLENLLRKILESEVYQKYLNLKEPSLQDDAEFWRSIIRDVILPDENFLDYLESKSVFWNDDLEIITTFILKTLKRMANPENEESAIMPMYKDKEDEEFGEKLFTYVIKNKDIYRHYIDDNLKQEKWESERLAFMDVVITMTALAEILNFPKIPLIASINEYIEIAKSYSTSKSGSFVNGLLASVIKKLKEEGLLLK